MDIHTEAFIGKESLPPYQFNDLLCHETYSSFCSTFSLIITKSQLLSHYKKFGALELHTPGTLPTRQSGVSPGACQFPIGWTFRLRFLARSAPEEDHHCVIAAALRPPTDWLRTTDEDVQ